MLWIHENTSETRQVATSVNCVVQSVGWLDGDVFCLLNFLTVVMQNGDLCWLC